MPNMEPSSKQIHRVVELSSGIRDDHYVSVDRKGRNPIEKLKEALSSKQAFQKYYLVSSDYLPTFVVDSLIMIHE